MTLLIEARPIRQNDFAAWRVLWDAYNAFYGRSGNTALPAEITAMTWARFFDEYEPMHARVAESSGVLVGLVHFIYHRSTIHLGPTCYLQDLFTVESVRGRGVGRALIQRVYDEARAAGSTRVYWNTHDTNAVAMRLYDHVAVKSGFVVYRKELGK